jgi:signal-transduction protein with cAMP-binding, CBS, and nucleotidyltransferase domain
MDMPISSMMTKTVKTANTEDTIESVEQLLRSQRLSSVPVTYSTGEVFGIISLTDLLHFHATDKNPKTSQAWELCTFRPIEVSPSASTEEVARLMVKNKIHHVIVTENRLIKGFVSSFDYLEKFLSTESALRTANEEKTVFGSMRSALRRATSPPPSP